MKRYFHLLRKIAILNKKYHCNEIRYHCDLLEQGLKSDKKTIQFIKRKKNWKLIKQIARINEISKKDIEKNVIIAAMKGKGYKFRQPEK